MKNEFDLDPEDLEFEDFSQDLEDFDEFDDEQELDDIQMRTAVLSKNNMVALLCIKTASAGGAICRVDPREANPSVQIYDDPQKAVEWFTKSLRTSKKNGWQIVYDGLPLQG
jgi:Fe-S-cluster formation regulator IscX/YfhJ